MWAKAVLRPIFKRPGKRQKRTNTSKYAYVRIQLSGQVPANSVPVRDNSHIYLETIHKQSSYFKPQKTTFATLTSLPQSFSRILYN